MNALILAAIFGVCQGAEPCMTYVADSQPETVQEVLLAHELLFPEGVCK